jgi:hypothetical protein
VGARDGGLIFFIFFIFLTDFYFLESTCPIERRRSDKNTPEKKEKVTVV